MRVLRAEREWSQATLAKKVGASRAFINAVEKGRYQPGLRLAFKIARAFGKRIEEVFLYEESEGCDEPARTNVTCPPFLVQS